MASNDPSSLRQKSAFEIQREAIISEILVSFDHVLSNLNHLNRALEGVAAVGREFESIEALWSKFDDVLSRETAVNAQAETGGGGAGAGGEQQQQQQKGTDAAGEAMDVDATPRQGSQ